MNALEKAFLKTVKKVDGKEGEATIKEINKKAVRKDITRGDSK